MKPAQSIAVAVVAAGLFLARGPAGCDTPPAPPAPTSGTPTPVVVEVDANQATATTNAVAQLGPDPTAGR